MLTLQTKLHANRRLVVAACLLLTGILSALAQHAAGEHGQGAVPGGYAAQEIHGSMAPGMDKMMAMQSSGNVDKDFATMMKMHHQMAIDMAKTELAKGDSKEMKAVANQIIKDAQRDIGKFDRWLDQGKAPR